MTKTETEIRRLCLIEKMSDEKISVELNIPTEAIMKITKKFKSRKKSNLENSIGQILRKIYPKYQILEQQRLEDLYMDYYIKDIRLCIEADGIQHTKLTPFYHGKTRFGSQMNFEHQIGNDRRKEKMAKEQHIYLIRIPHDEKLTIDNIRRILDEHSEKIIDNLNQYTSANRLYK